MWTWQLVFPCIFMGKLKQHQSIKAMNAIQNCKNNKGEVQAVWAASK